MTTFTTTTAADHEITVRALFAICDMHADASGACRSALARYAKESAWMLGNVANFSPADTAKALRFELACRRIVDLYPA